MSIVELDGGDSAASRVLRAYDRSSGQWALPKEGEFWSAVEMAHRLGRRGQGRRIAIIDGSFDASIPALTRQRFAHRPSASEASDHGSAVALLVHEVAPDAELLLYPVANGGSLDPNLVAEAMHALGRTDLDVVNLSLGEAHDWNEIHSPDQRPASHVPAESSFYAHLHDFAVRSQGRLPVSTEHLPLCRLARGITARGTTVVASIGNEFGKVYSPAIDESVVACGFQIVRRAITEQGEEIAWGDSPSFDQSHLNADLMIIQPAGVLGSSFAAPLVAGFVALMSDRAELPAFLQSARLASIASAAAPTLPMGDWDSDAHGVVASIYSEAIRTVPHRHRPVPDSDECPECALLARPAYVDWGLMRLKAGDLLGADIVLRHVRSFAPFDVHGAANLGVVLLELAKSPQSRTEVVRLLAEARQHLEFAVRARPEQREYAKRLHEVSTLEKSTM